MENKFDSSKYWEIRYRAGRTSGKGSYGKFSLFKAEVVNKFVKEHNIDFMIDFGCGDGNQASLFNCSKYIGFDVSETAIEICRKKFKGDSSKSFTNSIDELSKADLTLSCEVLFHLVELDKFVQYLQYLFGFSNKYVIIYSSNMEVDAPQPKHVKHRNFTNFILKYFPNWNLTRTILQKYPKECFSDFYTYEKINNK